MPTPVQESHQRAQTKKAYADEALFWAQKKWKRDDLIDGLNTQMEEGRVKKENSRREKNMWQAKFTAQVRARPAIMCGPLSFGGKPAASLALGSFGGGSSIQLACLQAVE